MRVEADASGAWTDGSDTLNLYAVLKAADSRQGALAGQYTLGGFQNLSGYRAGLMGSIAAACTTSYTVGLPPVRRPA